MSKSVNIEQYVEAKRATQHPSLSTKKTQRIILVACVAFVLLASAITLAILAYDSNPILFKNIIAGLAIIAMIAFIKIMSNQKTHIQKIKK